MNDKKAKLKLQLAVDMEAERQTSAYARTVLARLTDAQALSARDAPFGPRERNLENLTFAHGTRRNADGTEDPWAEVTRPE